MSNQNRPDIPFDSSLIDSVATSLDLRKPNREALETVISELSAPTRSTQPLVCDLATAVGKTYLAAGLIDYLAQTGVRNFLFVVPNKTIYNKTIANFTDGNPRTLLPDMTTEPVVIHPKNFNASWVASAMDDDDAVKLYVFNIQQLIAPSGANEGRKVRDDDNENLGISLYEALREQDDLIVLSDEHHMYAAKAAAFNTAIRDLDALAVVGLTATPDKTQVGDVVYHYPLARAIADQLVKTPCIVGRTDDQSDTQTRLLDGIALLKEIKRHADIYAQANSVTTVNPVMLVVANTIEQADEVAQRLRQADMFDDDDSVLVIHSEASDDDLEKLAGVEGANSPVRAIVSVQMLGVGWDVKNVYVIVSLRPSVSEALTEQTLGRGLRLPFGKYTDNEWLDTVEVLAHEQYKKLLAETDQILEGLVEKNVVKRDRANKARQRAAAKRKAEEYDKKRQEQVEATSSQDETSAEDTADQAGIAVDAEGQATINDKPLIQTAEERKKAAELQAESVDSNQVVVARTDVTLVVPVMTTKAKPKKLVLSTVQDDKFEEIGRRIADGEVSQLLREILNVKTTDKGQELDPRTAESIQAVALTLPLGTVEQELSTAIRTCDLVPENEGNAGAATRLAKAVISGAGGEDALAAELDAVKRMVLAVIEGAYADLEPDIDYDMHTESFAASKGNYRPVESNRYGPFSTGLSYSGWTRSLYPIVWFDSKPERDAANILDADGSVAVWVRLQRGDTPIPAGEGVYQPDFLVEAADGKQYMIEVKADRDLDSTEVKRKRKAAQLWATLASDKGLGDWTYLLVPQSAIKVSKTLRHLIRHNRKS